MFPVKHKDNRLRRKEWVLGVVINNEAKAHASKMWRHQQKEAMQQRAKKFSEGLSKETLAALKGMKRSGVSESEVFTIVQKINDAAFEVLTGKKPAKKKKE